MLSTGRTIGYYCPLSCGQCGALIGPSCTYYTNLCNSGTCQSVTYFGVSTVQCVCNTNYYGVTCNTRKSN